MGERNDQEGGGQERKAEKEIESLLLKFRSSVTMRSWRKESHELEKFRVGDGAQRAKRSQDTRLDSASMMLRKPGGQHGLYYANMHHT